MDLSNELISQLSNWLAATSQNYIVGNFESVLEAPDEHAVVAPVYVCIARGGKFLIHFVSPIDGVLRGKFSVDGVLVHKLHMGRAVTDEEKEATLQGLFTQVIG